MSYTDASESPSPRPGSVRWRKVLRRVVYPLAVIAAIVGVIWWLEARDDAPTSSTGERYGPVSMPEALATEGLDVAAEEGALAPDFLLETMDDSELRLSDLRGQPVVVNFWATWCKPCRQEMPRFVEASDKYAKDGLVVVAVNMQEGKGIVRPFAEDFGMDFPIAIDRDGEVGDRYRLLGLPTTVFIDRDGVVRSVYAGPFEEEQNETNVQGAIEDSELERRIAEIVGQDSAD
jgi:thiol-disulfide isomerase/thioredoxin